MRFAFCNEGFQDRPWRAVCAVIAQAGYEGVEIAPFTMAETVEGIPGPARAEIRQAAEEAGLEIVGLHWLLVKPEGLHIGHTEAAVRARTRDYLCQLTDFCADLGGRVMVFGSPRQRGGSGGATPQQAWQWAAEMFSGVLANLEARGVTLCIEPLTGAETDFVLTAAEGRRLVEQINHPSFRLMLDVKAMASEEQAPADLIRQHADLLAHVHANDANQQAPGFGDTDFRPILAALREVSYQGYLSVEPFQFPTDIETIARRARRYLNECLAA